MKRRLLGILLAVSCLVSGFTINSYAKEQLPTITDMWWDDNEVANWEEIDDVYRYEVKLYRGSTEVASSRTSKERVNFSSKITKSGNYRFRVRALGRNDFSDSSWSDYSETLEVTSADINEKKRQQENNKTTTTTGNGTTGVNGGPGVGVVAGEWVNQDGRWWFRNADGSYPKTQWMQIKEKWYFFDDEGWMKTGWINWDNKTYFCGEDGSMFVNDVLIDNVWYKFDASGALVAQ